MSSLEVKDEVLEQAADSSNTDDQLTLRALVSTKEAGVIIGKGGKNVAELREATGVKAGVSKVVQGVHDRVLTVSGTLEGVAKAYAFIGRTMLDNPISTSTPPASPSTPSQPTNTNSTAIITLRLLISHNLMGTVIGRQGAKIKHIQDVSGVRMTASKTLLPQSTERVVEVRGTVDAIQQAVMEIGQCLIEDKDRAYGTILYSPTKAVSTENLLNNGGSNSRRSSVNTNNFDYDNQQHQPQRRRSSFAVNNNNNNNNGNNNNINNNNNGDFRTQHISIPSDMVGCIIGKGGSKISEIRRLSGSHISIAKVPHDESGERMFTIQGTPEANERALYLLYGQLENEKERRLRGVITEDLLEEE